MRRWWTSPRHSGGLAEIDDDRLELRLIITESTGSKRALLPAPSARQ
ncbi:hypothetical protein IPZ58_30795 [Streptomyces roseoverticillatus]|nr:hypothetical protein [Streptomyces roseoverticillatus]MCF3105934.1 hypothetical protein [Streptomyces roseoverticillatus]